MKRFFAIIILLIMLFNGAGFYIFYFLRLQQIRIEMRQALRFLPVSELDVLTLTKAEFVEARVEDHEVKVDGKMYDIAWTEESDNDVTVYCKHDEKEDNLIALADFVLKTPVKQKIPSAVVQFLTLSFILPLTRLQFRSFDHTVVNKVTYSFSSRIFYPAISSPPPRVYRYPDQS